MKILEASVRYKVAISGKKGSQVAAAGHGVSKNSNFLSHGWKALEITGPSI